MVRIGRRIFGVGGRLGGSERYLFVFAFTGEGKRDQRKSVWSSEPEIRSSDVC